MLHTILIAVSLSVGQVPPQSPGGDLVLDIGAHLYRSDGSRSASGSNSGTDAFQGYVWSPDMLCGLAASGRAPRDTAGVGWRFSGRVIDRTGDDLIVQVEWQRLWENSTPLTKGPAGDVRLTLHAGDRFELDRVLPPAAGPCNNVIAKLEAAAVVRSPASTSRGGGVSGGRAQAGSGGSGGGGSGVSAGGAGAGAGDRQARVEALERLAEMRLLAAPAFDAELWLIHRLPDGSEDVQRRVASFGSNASTFAFPPVPIATARGRATVDVSGTLRVSFDRDVPSHLEVAIDRRIKADGQPDRTGNSGKRIPLPAPAEVISFELPSSVFPAQDPLSGHRFSVRLRVTPR